jgi:hypothetical protein
MENAGKIALAFTTYSALCCLSLGKSPTSHQLEQRGDKATPMKGVMQLDGRFCSRMLGIDGISR